MTNEKLHFDPKEITDNIVCLFERELIKTNAKHTVIGISGGLDSAVTAALAKRAGKNINVPVVGFVIPILQKPSETANACKIAEEFTDAWQIVDLTSLYTSFVYAFNSVFVTPFSGIQNKNVVAFIDSKTRNEEFMRVNLGNIRARLRMIYLYNMARILQGPVLSTDNYSEKLMSYFSIHGDHNDIGPIQHVFKGIELPYIARELNIPENIINAVPTDGLGISNSDMDQLGAENYVELDEEMLRILNNIEPKNPKALYVERYYDPVVEFKRNWPRNFSREEIGMPSVQKTYNIRS